MGLSTKLFRRRFCGWGVVCFLMCFLFFNASVSIVTAGPEGAQVVNGQVTIQQSGSNTAITASDKAIINYSSFDIAQPETVQFIQPGSTASVLNRILSANPTNINGTLLANGRVFFVNPAGVYIGNGARINVNQLVASGLNITNADFINGSYNFAGGNGAVINDGDISARQVYLIGRQVTNSGNISCPAGYVVMAAGDRVFLGEPGSDIVLDVEGTSLSESANAAASEVGVLNEGTIDAAGGIIALAAAGDIYSQAISNVGSLSTSVDAGDAGQIKLTAAGGDVINTGSIEASGSEGGQVAMEGARVGQFGTIHADGTTGDGGNVDLTASDVVALNSDSITTANAGINGNGGEVIVYSPETALFRPDALIEAKGGTVSGDGGFIEVSGKNHVEIFGRADAGATNGIAGTFLIDPTNITIAATPAVEDIIDDLGGTFTCNADDNIILNTTIEGYLKNGTSVVLDTSNGDGSGGGLGDEYEGFGDIIQNSGASINKTDGGDASLTLTAERNIDLDGGIVSTSGKLDVVLDATGSVAVNSAVTTNGGSFSSIGTTFDNTGGAITTEGGSVALTHTGAVTIGANIDTSSVTGGAISVKGSLVNLNGQLVANNVADDTISVSVNASGGSIQVDNDPDAEIITDGSVSLTADTIFSTGSHDLELDGAKALDVVDTGAGDIDIRCSNNDSIDIDNGYVLSNIDLDQEDSPSFSYTAETGDITVNTVNLGNKTITIKASNGAINDASDDTNIDIVAGTTSLTASSIGTSAILEVDTDTLNADTSASNGEIKIDLLTDATDIGDVTAGTGIVTLDATGQSIDSASNDDTADIVAGTTNLTASSIGTSAILEVDTDTLNADTSASNGEIKIDLLTDATNIGDVTAGAGSVMLDATAAINDDADDATGIRAATLILRADGEIGGTRSLQTSVGSLEASTSSGDIVITETDNVTLGDIEATTGNIVLQATNGAMTHQVGKVITTAVGGSLSMKSDGDLNMANYDVANPNTTDLILDSTGGSAIVTGSAADNWKSITAAAQYDVVLSGDGDIRTGNLETQYAGGSSGVKIFTETGSGGSLDAQGTINSGGIVTVDVEGNASFAQPISAEGKIELTAKGDISTKTTTSTAGNIEIRSTGGDLIVEGPVNADENPSDGIGGGVSLISETGKIYTPGGANDTLNVAITGYSAPGVGVELPGPGSGVSAIAIGSSKDLIFGDSAKLNAGGIYTPGTPAVDDRLAVGFDPSINGGADPIDVAIYLRSNRLDASSNQIGTVTVGSEVTIADNGTMVIDAGEKVLFNGDFYKSVFDTSNRLEVVSRRSETLGEVITYQRLPHADNPEAIRELFNETSTGYFAGAYVLRGVKTLLAEVLALTNPVPLVPPRTLEPEFRSEVEGPDTEALAELLSELGIGVQPYVTEAYADFLSTDLRLYKAAEKLQELMPVLEDVNGIHIAGLRETVAEYFPTLDVLSDERMDSFAQVLASHKGDGTDYDLAGQCIFALSEYINILGTDIGWPVETSVEFVMGRYVPRLTENDEIRIAVIQMHLQK